MTSPLFGNGPPNNHPIILKGHSNIVWSVAFSPSLRLLASTSSDSTIQLWDTESGSSINIMKGHSHRDNTVKLWDVGSRAEIATFRGHSNSVFSVAFTLDGARLVSGSGDKNIRVWDVKSRTNTSILEGHSDWVRSVAFSPDGKIIASGSDDHTIRFWDATSETAIAILKGYSNRVMSIAFSPSGEYLASGSADRTIRLWNVTTRAHITTMKGHSNIVTSVAFSPNGKYLASGSSDNTVQLWDVASRSNISTLKGHSEYVNCVTFSPDGTHLASGSHDKTIRIWKLASEDAIAPQISTLTPDLMGLTGATADSQQDTITPASISVPQNSDITGSVSLEGGRLIGGGGFGELFLGTHKEKGKVALKKPRRVLDEALIRRFLREVDLWCSVSHQYILPCLGMCKIGFDVYVVSPFIENGDLMACMARGMDLNRNKLLFEIAEALTHLHHRGIIHGDVKAQNILLADDGSALLCDFGLAKAFDTMATSTEVKGAGSVRWMAPELFQDESRSMASDVYSLGITIAEVVSGRMPYPNMSSNLAIMRYVADRGGRPAKDPLTSPEGKSYAILWETAEKCWVDDAKARPHMAQVLGMLFPLTRERA